MSDHEIPGGWMMVVWVAVLSLGPTTITVKVPAYTEEHARALIKRAHPTKKIRSIVPED